MPGADVRLLLPRPPGVVGDHAADLAVIADHRVELERLQDRVVITTDRFAVLAQHLELVAHRLYVGVEVAGVAVLGDELERHLLAGTTDPDRRVWLLHRLGLVDCAPGVGVGPVQRGFGPRPPPLYPSP